jgi:hypothetical protein
LRFANKFLRHVLHGDPINLNNRWGTRAAMFFAAHARDATLAQSSTFPSGRNIAACR